MELFGPQWIAACRYLAQVANRLPGRGLLGRRRGRLPAGGTELTGHRDYSAGDDYRQVDWLLAARHDELLTRQYEGETDLRTYVLLDASRSMSLGRPPKFDLARQVAAALAYLALSRLQRVAITTFADGIVDDCPAIGQPAQYLKILKFLSTCNPTGKASSLTRTIERLAGRYQRRGLAVIVSDLYDPGGFARGIDLLRFHGYTAAVVQVYDPGDLRPPELGDIELLDVETETSLSLTVTERMEACYGAVSNEFHQSVRTCCASRDVPCAQVPIDWPRDEALLAAIGARPTSEDSAKRYCSPMVRSTTSNTGG